MVTISAMRPGLSGADGSSGRRHFTGLFLAAASLLVVLTASQCLAMGTRPQPAPGPGRILVQFKAGVSEGRAREVVAQEGCQVVSHLLNLDLYVVWVPAGVGVEKAMKRLTEHPEVLYADKDTKSQPLEGR